MKGIKSCMCWLLDRLKADSPIYNSSRKLLVVCSATEPLLRDTHECCQTISLPLDGPACCISAVHPQCLCHAFLSLSADPLVIYVSLIGHDSWPRSFSPKVPLYTLCRTVGLQSRKDYLQQTPSHDLGETLILARYKQSHLWPMGGGFVVFIANSDGTGDRSLSSNNTTLFPSDRASGFSSTIAATGNATCSFTTITKSHNFCISGLGLVSGLHSTLQSKPTVRNI